MDKQEKIRFAKRQIADIWKCDMTAFDADENIFLQSTDTFFEVITFGKNAVVRADEK